MDASSGEPRRKNPWLKPDWSPDTLISYFYFGNIFAVRTEACREIPWLGSRDFRKNLYDFCLKAVEIKGEAGHIDSVLFHNTCPICPFGMEEKYEDIKKEAYIRRGWPLKPEGMVSIVIPSKDNPGVLSTCVHSILEASTYRNFEIIVIDNGSSEKNKDCLLYTSLRTVFLCFLIMRSSLINARTSIIPMMKAVLPGMTRISALGGLFRKA